MISLGKRTLLAASVLTAIGLAVGAGVLGSNQQAIRRLPPSELRSPTPIAAGSQPFPMGVPSSCSASRPTPRDPIPGGDPTVHRWQGALRLSPKNLSVPEDFVLHVIAARVTGLPADADRGWGVKEAGGSCELRGDERRQEGARCEHGPRRSPQDLEACSVELHAATGPWQTVGVSDGHSPGGVSSAFGPSYIFGEAVAGKKGAILTVSHDIGDVAVRIVAVDRAGRERPQVGQTATGVKDFYQIAAVFDLGPEAIQEYRLQTRPYERVEIPGIALKAERPQVGQTVER